MDYRSSTASGKLVCIAVENPAAAVKDTSRLKLRKFKRLMRVPLLTRGRIILALAMAVVADGLQLLLGWFGWAGADQAIDLVAMVMTSWALGFHWLLLPTFTLELVPVLEDLPTWTACVIAVVALRKRQQTAVRPEHSEAILPR